VHKILFVANFQFGATPVSSRTVTSYLVSPVLRICCVLNFHERFCSDVYNFLVTPTIMRG